MGLFKKNNPRAPRRREWGGKVTGRSSRRGITHPWNGAERTKRSGELHKRSAEAWGDRLRSPASSRDSALTAPGAKPLSSGLAIREESVSEATNSQLWDSA